MTSCSADWDNLSGGTDDVGDDVGDDVVALSLSFLSYYTHC